MHESDPAHVNEVVFRRVPNDLVYSSGATGLMIAWRSRRGGARLVVVHDEPRGFAHEGVEGGNEGAGSTRFTKVDIVRERSETVEYTMGNKVGIVEHCLRRLSPRQEQPHRGFPPHRPGPAGSRLARPGALFKHLYFVPHDERCTSKAINCFARPIA